MRPDGLTPENFPLLDEFAIPEGGVCGAFSSEAALNPTDELLEKQADGVELCQQDNPKRQVGQENMEQQELTVETTDANHPTHASVKSAQRKTVEWDDDDIQSIERAEQEKAELENDGYALVDTVRLGLSKWRLIYEMEKTAGSSFMVNDKVRVLPDEAVDSELIGKTGIVVEVQEEDVIIVKMDERAPGAYYDSESRGEYVVPFIADVLEKIAAGTTYKDEQYGGQGLPKYVKDTKTGKVFGVIVHENGDVALAQEPDGPPWLFASVSEMKQKIENGEFVPEEPKMRTLGEYGPANPPWWGEAGGSAEGLPEKLTSGSRTYTVVEQTDGNVALYEEGETTFPSIVATVEQLQQMIQDGVYKAANAGGGLESNDVVAPEGLPTKAEDEQGGQDMQNRENATAGIIVDHRSLYPAPEGVEFFDLSVLTSPDSSIDPETGIWPKKEPEKMKEAMFPNFNDLPENERFLMRLAVMVDNDIAETPTDVLRDTLDTIRNRRSDAEPTQEQKGYETKILEELKNRGVEAGRRPFKRAGVDESVYQGFLNAMRGTGAQSMQEEFDVMARQMGLGGQQITEIAERLTADGFEVTAGRRPFEKKAVTPADLSDQVLDKSRAGEFLYCPSCGGQWSASSGDYFMMPENEEFVCQECGEPLVLATSENRINIKGGSRPFRDSRGRGVKQASKPVPGFDSFIWEDEDENTARPKLIKVTEDYGDGAMMMGGQRVRFELIREADDPVGEATGRVFRAYRVASVKNAEEDGPAWGDHAKNMKDTEAWQLGYDDAKYQTFSYVPENVMEYMKGKQAYEDENSEVPLKEGLKRTAANEEFNRLSESLGDKPQQVAFKYDWTIDYVIWFALGMVEGAGVEELAAGLRSAMPESEESAKYVNEGRRTAQGLSPEGAVLFAFLTMEDANAHSEGAPLWDWLKQKFGLSKESAMTPEEWKGTAQTGSDAALYYYPELNDYVKSVIGGDVWGMSGYGDPQSDKRVLWFKLHPREWEARFGGDDYYVVIYPFAKTWNLQNSQGEKLVEGNGSPEDPGNMERIGKWFGKF